MKELGYDNETTLGVVRKKIMNKAMYKIEGHQVTFNCSKAVKNISCLQKQGDPGKAPTRFCIYPLPVTENPKTCYEQDLISSLSLHFICVLFRKYSLKERVKRKCA